jgi:uncharacterized repeat protein (TIGR03803 family)
MLRTLVTFNGANGQQPQAGLTIDSTGNLYGTTWFGGTNDEGTAFELSGPDHSTFTTLINFADSPVGANPIGGLLIDAAGNVFGTTEQGGVGRNGTVFELSGSDHQTVTRLWTFTRTDGAEPDSTLTADGNGNLYGTTTQGGDNNEGTVFEISGSGFVVPEPGTLSLILLTYMMPRRRARR